MAEIDKEFRALCKQILTEGRTYVDERRNVERLQIPSYTFRHSFKDGFPAITNKKLYWKGIVGELLWFLRGQTNVKILKNDGIDIWDKDAYNLYVKTIGSTLAKESEPEHLCHKSDDGMLRLLKMEEFTSLLDSFENYSDLVNLFSLEGYTLGDVGQNYSAQWRNFNGKTDQIANLVRDMKENIMGSRLKVNAWNPSEIFMTALPPCHSEFQIVGIPLTLAERMEIYLDPANNFSREEFDENTIPTRTGNEPDSKVFFESLMNESGIPKFGFEMHWIQRSVDTFLGLPFNIASYGLLAKILEALTGYPALGIEGDLKCVHFYDNQYEAVKLMLSRDENTHPNCSLEMTSIRKKAMDLDYFLEEVCIDDIKLIGYTSDAGIKVEMLAPIKI